MTQDEEGTSVIEAVTRDRWWPLELILSTLVPLIAGALALTLFVYGDQHSHPWVRVLPGLALCAGVLVVPLALDIRRGHRADVMARTGHTPSTKWSRWVKDPWSLVASMSLMAGVITQVASMSQ